MHPSYNTSDAMLQCAFRNVYRYARVPTQACMYKGFNAEDASSACTCDVDDSTNRHYQTDKNNDCLVMYTCHWAPEVVGF